jgi:hypothetical protein
LTNVEIKYGFKDGTPYSYKWQGNLSFMAMDTVTLPAPDWDEAADTNKNIFHFELVAPNGQTDPTPNNNKMESPFIMPPMLKSGALIFELRTNHAPKETTWKLYNTDGYAVYQNVPGSMYANELYTANMELRDGSYRLCIYDSGEDGLYYPFYGTSGSATLKRYLGSIPAPFYTFNPNFGKETEFWFAVNKYVGIKEIENVVQDLIIFPNPVQSTIYVETSNMGNHNNMTANIYDMFGKHIISKDMSASQLNEINVEHLATGLYIITIENNNKLIGRNKFVISR